MKPILLTAFALVLGWMTPIHAEIIGLPTQTPTLTAPHVKVPKVPLKDLYRNPDKYLGRTIRIEGFLHPSGKSKQMHWLGRIVMRADEGLTDGDYGLFIGGLTFVYAKASKSGAKAIRLTGTLQRDNPDPKLSPSHWSPFQKPGYSFRTNLSDAEYIPK